MQSRALARIEVQRGMAAIVAAEEGSNADAQILDLVIIRLNIIEYLAVLASQAVRTLLNI